jgi:hypothetical protein
VFHEPNISVKIVLDDAVAVALIAFASLTLRGVLGGERPLFSAAGAEAALEARATSARALSYRRGRGVCASSPPMSGRPCAVGASPRQAAIDAF